MTVAERTPLFELLPAVYRIRNAEGDGALEALLSIVDAKIDAIEGDVASLYDDWFIETCADWLVPYIGDLLGVRNLHEIDTANFSGRGYVANTLAYRRRKGTLAVLEQLAKDVTGWSAKAVEFFELLSTTQYLNHLRPHNLTTLDLRSPGVSQAGTAFETAAHTAEMRRIAPGRGRYNILNIGIYLWTLQPYAVFESVARRISPPDFRFFFDPVDLTNLEVPPPLFNSPEAEAEITDLAQEFNVAGSLRRRPLHDELEQLRQMIADGIPDEDREPAVWFDTSPVFQIRIGSETDPIPPEEVVICNLDSAGVWRRPPATKSYVSTAAGAGSIGTAGPTVTGTGTVFTSYFEVGDSILAGDQTVAISSIGSDSGIQTTAPFNPPLPNGSSYRRSRPRSIRVGVDPKLGRIALAEGENHDELRISYTYGFSGDVGAGPYDRRDAPERWFEPPLTIESAVGGGFWHVGVAKNPDPAAVAPNEIFETLGEAIDEWNIAAPNLGSSPTGLITIMDSSTYAESLSAAQRVSVAPDATLIIVAADWSPFTDNPLGPLRPDGRIQPVGLRPHIHGDIEIEGTTAPDGHGGRVILDGLLVEGQVTVLPGDLRHLSVGHCTFVPEIGGLLIDSTDADGSRNEQLTVELFRTISGRIESHERIEGLRIIDSIIDAATSEDAIKGLGDTAGPRLTIERSTIMGRTRALQIDLGSESIFTERVRVRRTQDGCMRFSYIPRNPDPDLDSRTPRRYRCQPDLALVAHAREHASELGLQPGQKLPESIASGIRSRVRPFLTATDYGAPGYTQLMPTTATEIATGAENQSEMGVWSHLMRPQREANLRTALDEYLRFGLEAGPIFVT